LQPLLEHPEIELVALSDPYTEHAEKLAKEHGISRVYADYRDMLRDPDIEVVDICAPNVFHSEVSIAALEAGKHVFCEKPDAINAAEAQKMADAAARSGKLLMTMRNNRFSPASQYLKRYIEEGLMGEIYTGRCGWLRRRGIPGKGGWFTNKSMSGGGPLIDLGVHFIDLAMWLMGNPRPVAVSGATYAKFADYEPNRPEKRHVDKKGKGVYDVEDLAVGFIRFENGASLQLEFSWASNVEDSESFVELRGTKAGSSIRKGQLSIFSEAAGQLVNITPILPKAQRPGHAEHLYHFIDCLQDRAEPIITPVHGLDMIKILCAVYESAESGFEVRL
jgi:predicted dehydrogenase